MYSENIQKLLLKYFDGNASASEIEILDQWIVDNREEYENEVLIYFFSNEKKHPIDVSLAHKKFIKKINDSKIITLKPKRSFNLLKYAAMFIAVSAGTFFFYQNNQKNSFDYSNKTLSEYKKVTLVLEDGKEVVLEDNKEIKSNSNVKITNGIKILKFNVIAVNKELKSSDVKYNTLFIPEGEMYQLELPDGTKVWLNSATSIKFPSNFSSDKREVAINGEGYFEVTKSTTQPFIVKTKEFDVKVLGTKFNVSSYDDDLIKSTSLAEGSVELNPTDDKSEKALLKPGQKGVISEGTIGIKVKYADVKQDIAWKDGKYYFKKEKLGTIVTKLGRWYNVDFKFENPTLKNYTFTGIAQKDKPVEFLLDIISQTSNVNYKIITNPNSKKKMFLIKNK
mgnify:CR=1 FL=1